MTVPLSTKSFDFNLSANPATRVAEADVEDRDLSSLGDQAPAPGGGETADRGDRAGAAGASSPPPLEDALAPTTDDEDEAA